MEHYAAYGLALRSSFRLAGMTPGGGEGLAPLDLLLATPAELSGMWSGALGPPVWRGRLGDGRALTVERGAAEDLLFRHGDCARFHLDPQRRSLACAPALAGLQWQRTLITKVLSCVSLLCGYEALHASAVDSPHGAVAILAPAGMGKTTVALELMRRGWPLLSDDVLALAGTPQGVLAFPGTPHMNLDAAAGALAPSVAQTLGIVAGERWVAARGFARRPRPLRAVCLLQRGARLPLRMRVAAASPLAIAPYMLGLLDTAERERSRFELYAQLAGSLTLMHLSCGELDRPGVLADLIERTVADPPRTLIAAGAR